jgi:hypothetical protein
MGCNGDGCRFELCREHDCCLHHPIDDRLDFVLHEKEDATKSTCKWLGSLEHETHEICMSHCFSTMMQPISFQSMPSVLVFELTQKKFKSQ